MAQDIVIRGVSVGTGAEVDASNNLKVTLPSVAAQSGYNRPMSEVDAGLIAGAATLLSAEVSQDYALRVSPNSILGRDVFNYAAQDTGLSSSTAATMTLAYGGQLATNASGITTINTGVNYVSKQFFPVFAASQTYCYLKLRWTGTWAATNTTLEVGLALPGATATAAPLDGVFIRASSVGLVGVSNVNGTEQITGVWKTSAAGPAFSPTLGIAYDIIVSVSSRVVVFWIDYQLGNGFETVATLPLAAATRRATYGQSMPFYVSHRIGGTAASAVIGMQVLEWVVTNDGVNNLRGEAMTAALLTGGQQGQPGQTVGATAAYTNNQAPGAGAAMTNTTAALGTGLGGQFAALPTLAASTDGIVCSYQNPVGTVAVSGKQLAITGVTVQAVVTTALAGNATPVIFVLALNYGHTNVSLATTESANTKAPRRVLLGAQTFAAAAALGGLGGLVQIKFDRPIPVFPGEFVAVSAKNVGAVTVTGVVTFLVIYDYGWIL